MPPLKAPRHFQLFRNSILKPWKSLFFFKNFTHTMQSMPIKESMPARCSCVCVCVWDESMWWKCNYCPHSPIRSQPQPVKSSVSVLKEQLIVAPPWMMPTPPTLCRMLSSAIKPLKTGLQEKPGSSLIPRVTWHLSVSAALSEEGNREGSVKHIHFLSHTAFDLHVRK